MDFGNVHTPFPGNLRDPMHAQPATVRLKDLFLVLPQSVDLGLLSIASAFRASRDLTGRFVLVLVVVLVLVLVLVLESGHAEYRSVECCANSELHPDTRLAI